MNRIPAKRCPLRKVLYTETIPAGPAKPPGPCRIFYLECGHAIRRTTAASITNKKHCEACYVEKRP